MTQRRKKPEDHPGCEECPWKMTCLGLKEAPCTVMHLDLNQLHEIFPVEVVRRIVTDIFKKDDS